MLQGKNIRLRAMEPEDIDLLLKWENDESNWLYSNTLRPFSRRAIERHVLQSHDIYTEKQLRLMISLIEDGSTVGSIDLFECDFTHGRAGVGILIGETSARRNGYALEAIELIVDYSRDVLMFHQLHADVLATNPGSISLFERAGFARCGVWKDWVKHKEGYSDMILFQRILSENGEK